VQILVTGGKGQLGYYLVACLTAAGHRVVAPSSQELNIGEPGCVAQLVAAAPQLVIHSAAYTNVDGCARDPRLAQRVNTLGTQYVALACQALGVPLVYISTNEVFAGDAQQPYFEYDTAQPINAYGRSKWGGEQVVRALVPRHYICRVAWLYGGPRSFVRTVLRLAEQQSELRMVADEVGSPTYAADAADAITQLIARPFYGTYHIVNAGQTSRYAFAEAVLAHTGQQQVRLQPITLAEFVRDSSPPPFTPLVNNAAAALGIALRPWDEALAAYLADARAATPSTP
jgi:dTDP-4-dehydrorhamnose reductase